MQTTLLETCRWTFPRSAGPPHLRDRGTGSRLYSRLHPHHQGQMMERIRVECPHLLAKRRTSMLRHGTATMITLILTVLIAMWIQILMIQPHQAWATRRWPNRRRLQLRKRSQGFTGSNFMVHRLHGRPRQGQCRICWRDVAHLPCPLSKVRSAIRHKEVGARLEHLLRSHVFHRGSDHLVVQNPDRLRCFLIDSEVSCMQVLSLLQQPMSWQPRAETVECSLPRKEALPAIIPRQGTQVERTPLVTKRSDRSIAWYLGTPKRLNSILYVLRTKWCPCRTTKR